ncbi:MAG: methyl-accepting chemotaxis protein [Thermodesulfobacteriota bacterium]
MSKPYKRRNYFINKELQGRQVLVYFSMVVLGSMVFSLLFGLITTNTMSISYDNYTLQIGTTPKVLFHKFFTAEWLFILVGGMAVAVIAIFLSHRVAGPLYKLEHSVEDMIHGNFAAPIFLRRKDEGQALAEKLNRLNAMLSARIHEMRHLNRRMEQHLHELQAGIATAGDCDKARIVLQEMTSVNGQSRELLDDFIIREE